MGSQIMITYPSSVHTDSCGRKRRYYHVPCANPKCSNVRKLQRTDVDPTRVCAKCQRNEARRQSRLQNPSSIEMGTRKRLEGAQLDFRSEYPLHVDGRDLLVDFWVIVDGKPVAIECCDQNDYFHSIPEQKERDALKRSELARRGIPVVEIVPALVNEVVNLVRAVVS